MKSISYFNKNYKNFSNATAEITRKIEEKTEKPEVSPLANHRMDDDIGKVTIITAKDHQ